MARYSSSRQRILNEFHKGELFTAADIVKMLPDIDQATIYRNINKLVEEAYIKEVKIKRGTASYELKGHNHQHFVCNVCRKVFPFDFDYSKIKKELEKKGMTVDGLEINASGKCLECKNKW